MTRNWVQLSPIVRGQVASMALQGLKNLQNEFPNQASRRFLHSVMSAWLFFSVPHCNLGHFWIGTKRLVQVPHYLSREELLPERLPVFLRGHVASAVATSTDLEAPGLAPSILESISSFRRVFSCTKKNMELIS